MEILYLLAFVFSVLVLVLLIRFLWMVPTDLRDINNRLRMFFYMDDDPSDDFE